VQRVDRKTEKKYSNLWLVPTGRGKARQFTFGDQSDRSPRWSPDGRTIAFISNRDDEKQPQIYLIPFDGGEARQLTDLQGSVGGMEWSPDGRKLLLSFRKKEAEAIEREKDPAKKELGVVSRRYDRIFYRMDGAGYLPHEQWHIWTVDGASGKATQLTDSDKFDEGGACWSPDGKQIAFVANRSDNPDLTPDEQEIYVMDVDGRNERHITTAIPGPKGALSWSPDGRYLAYIAWKGGGEWWRNNNLYITALDGSEPGRILTDSYDIYVGNNSLADCGDHPAQRPRWSADGRQLYFQVTRHGRTKLSRIDLDGQNLTDIIDQPALVNDYAWNEKAGQWVYMAAHIDAPDEIFACDADGQNERPLTRLNAPLFKKIDLIPAEEVWFKGSDDNDLQGWIVKPPDFDPAKKYPSIMQIHGGPWLQYGHGLMHEMYFLAAQGYVVFYGNPRGGQGYGEAHSSAIADNWGDKDYQDLMRWADYMAAQPYIDPERMGVAGGSYGGYMTTWIIGHTQRFKAAVAMRVVSNLISMWGSSDFNYAFQHSFGGKPPWENFDNFWRQSPMKYIGNAVTPTLVIHSEQDLRCQLEQGQQVYTALKYMGVPSEFVIFPEESHGLSRIGRTDRRIARLNHILRWFNAYL
jgi:dipeptidyl aminopeptidase/acylaminoacyl peptidase